MQERGTPGDKSDLAISYGCIGDIYESQGNPEEALNWYQKDCALSEQVVQERGTPRDKNNLANSYSNIARIYAAQCCWGKVMEFQQKAKEMKTEQ